MPCKMGGIFTFVLVSVVGSYLFFGMSTNSDGIAAEGVKVQSLSEKARPSKNLPKNRSKRVSADRRDLAVQKSSSSPPSTSPEPAHSTDRSAFIRIEDYRLSARLRDRPLAWVLGEISRKSGIPIVSAEGLSDAPISAEVQDLPLSQGLEKILKDFDVFILHSAEGQALSSVKGVWVYPQGAAQGMRPVPPNAWTSTAEAEEGLNSANPADRGSAIETLVEREGRQAQEALSRALLDEDEEVRTQAIYAARNSGVELPAQALMELVQSDPSPTVRFMALEAVAEDAEFLEAVPENESRIDEIRVVAELALGDPIPYVKEQAQQILAQLDAPDPPPEAFERQQGAESLSE